MENTLPNPTNDLSDANAVSNSSNIPTINNSITSGNNKTRHGAPWWLVGVLGFLSVFGLVLGGYEMFQHIRTQEEINKLKAEAVEKDKMISNLGAQLGNQVNESNRPGYQKPNNEGDNNTNNTATSEDGYIYIGEWGVKFKIPEGLTSVSYTYNYYDSEQSWVCATGKPTSTESTPEFSILSNVGTTGLGCISRFSESYVKDNERFPSYNPGEEYYYAISGPQAVYSTDKTEQELEVETVTLIEKLFTSREKFQTANYFNFTTPLK